MYIYTILANLKHNVYISQFKTLLFVPMQVFAAKQVDTVPIRTVLLNLTKYAEGRLLVVHSAGRNSVNVWQLVRFV